MPRTFSSSGALALGHLADARDEAAPARLEDGLEQLILVLEVVVDEPVGDARLARHVRDAAAVVALAREHLDRGAQDGAAALTLPVALPPPTCSAAAHGVSPRPVDSPISRGGRYGARGPGSMPLRRGVRSRHDVAGRRRRADTTTLCPSCGEAVNWQSAVTDQPTGDGDGAVRRRSSLDGIVLRPRWRSVMSVTAG